MDWLITSEVLKKKEIKRADEIGGGSIKELELECSSSYRLYNNRISTVFQWGPRLGQTKAQVGMIWTSLPGHLCDDLKQTPINLWLAWVMKKTFRWHPAQHVLVMNDMNDVNTMSPWRLSVGQVMAHVGIFWSSKGHLVGGFVVTLIYHLLFWDERAILTFCC